MQCKIYRFDDLTYWNKLIKMNMRKYIKWLGAFAAATVSVFSSQSCMKDNGYDMSLLFPNAVVTVKPVDGTPSFYLQLDDQTTLEPVNIMSSPYGDKEVRALVNYSEIGEPSTDYDKKVHINWIDDILTKDIVKDLGAENDATYGTDAVEIATSWVNIAEDGYLTLQFMTLYGNSGTAHEVNLLNVGTEENPYIVEFRHNAHGDYSSSMASGLAAFRLDGQESGVGLPDTEGKTVELTLKYKSFEGEKTMQFKYCTRKTTEPGNIDTQADYRLKIK